MRPHAAGGPAGADEVAARLADRLSPKGRLMIPRYTLPEMGAIWTDQARFEGMLRVEIAVARAEVSRGMVPATAVKAIESRARVDVDRIAEI